MNPNELKSAESVTGQQLYEQWCGNSYYWDAVTGIEKIRFEHLADFVNHRTLNAYKAGMTEAAEICHNHDGGVLKGYWLQQSIQQAILTACDNKTL